MALLLNRVTILKCFSPMWFCISFLKPGSVLNKIVIFHFWFGEAELGVIEDWMPITLPIFYVWQMRCSLQIYEEPRWSYAFVEFTDKIDIGFSVCLPVICTHCTICKSTYMVLHHFIHYIYKRWSELKELIDEFYSEDERTFRSSLYKQTWWYIYVRIC